MSATLETFDRDRSAGQALRTLRTIRQRYDDGHAAHPEAPSFSVQVGLGFADRLWLTAAIEVLEKAIADAPEG